MKRGLGILILAQVVFLVAATLVSAQEETMLSLANSSWSWRGEGMLINYDFGQQGGMARVILTEDNQGYQMTQKGCHFEIPFTYKTKGDLVYVYVDGNVCLSKISFSSDGLISREVEGYVRTFSALGETEEMVTDSPHVLERVKN